MNRLSQYYAFENSPFSTALVASIMPKDARAVTNSCFEGGTRDANNGVYGVSHSQQIRQHNL